MRGWLVGMVGVAGVVGVAALTALAGGVQAAGEEERARALMREVGCPVCGGQAVSESESEVAGAMRDFIRVRVAAGEGDEEIRSALVARYGEGVRLRPPLRGWGLVVWLLPLLVLMLGAWVVIRVWRR